VLEARTRAIPVLLLDDVSSELDRERTARLFKLVGALGAQVFVTTTDPAIADLLPGARRFTVADGGITPRGAG
jgi:recombinational DNA repair ATPase RecF